MTYREAVAYLRSLVNYEQHRNPEAMRAVELGRMRQLCRRLGDPQRSFRSVLVTGTNGKGSICAMLYSMLRESSLRVGLYTSPHLEDPRERIRVWTSGAGSGERVQGEDWIGETAFAALVEQIQSVAERLRAASPQQPLAYFEVFSAIAFLYFQQQRVEIAVLEVGLGGRLDATNVVDQAVSLIAPIDVDHAEVLGADPVAIAKEKAGIIKPNQAVITAPQPPGVMEVLRAAADAQGVPLLTCGGDLTVRIHRHDLEGLQASITGLRGIYESLEIPLLGRHQASNAAMAVGALEALSTSGVPSSIVERGLARAEWPGRFEVIHEAPLVILDVAHNPHAAAALRETLTELCPGRHIQLLIGLSADKPAEAMGELLGGLAGGVTCTKSSHPRAMEPTELAQRLVPFCADVHVMSDAADALTYLLNAASPSDVIVVTGSLFLVGELRTALRQSHAWNRRPAAAASQRAGVEG